MTPETHDLFRAVINPDSSIVQQALAAGADINATDELGRNVLAYAALGPA
jgi:ankyrin repeat protein